MSLKRWISIPASFKQHQILNFKSFKGRWSIHTFLGLPEHKFKSGHKNCTTVTYDSVTYFSVIYNVQARLVKLWQLDSTVELDCREMKCNLCYGNYKLDQTENVLPVIHFWDWSKERQFVSSQYPKITLRLKT